MSRDAATAPTSAPVTSFALNILRANGADNISRELYINALNPNHALAYSVS